jgi:DNA (cytosine-5)-methyltransferase 1
MAAYYNEIDPFAAQWLRNLIAKNLIAPGDVDERSIRDVKPDDLRNYTQCHFFAGIGVWSYALRRAGWADDRPVWTGSCPCQPFSAAGKQEGTADARHLWPEWFRLIRAHRPQAVFGEQVASAEVIGSQLETAFIVAVQQGEFAKANKLAKRLAQSPSFHFWPRWLDLISTELEGCNYTIRPGIVGAHSVGAPHIRQRLFFVADAAHANGRSGERGTEAGTRADRERGRGLAGGSAAGGMEHAAGEQVGIPGRARESRSANGVVGDTEIDGRQGRHLPETAGRPESGVAASGFWSACDWLPCIDGKARPVEPGTFPLAHGAPARVGRLRAYGNAINAETAAAFIEAYLGR